MCGTMSEPRLPAQHTRVQRELIWCSVKPVPVQYAALLRYRPRVRAIYSAPSSNRLPNTIEQRVIELSVLRCDTNIAPMGKMESLLLAGSRVAEPKDGKNNNKKTKESRVKVYLRRDSATSELRRRVTGGVT